MNSVAFSVNGFMNIVRCLKESLMTIVAFSKNDFI